MSIFQKIMHNGVLNQIKGSIIKFWNTVSAFYFVAAEKIKYSPKALHYISACVIGLGLARLVNSSVLAYVSSGEEHAIGRDPIRRQHPIVSHGNTDILSIVGGSIYGTAPTIKASLENGEHHLINYSLIGTLEGHPSFANAVIQILEGNQAKVTKEYTIGSKIGQDVIAWVGRGYYYCQKKREKITIKIGQNAFEVMQKKAEQTAGLSSGNSSTINKTISRQDVLSIMKGNASSIYQGASFGPDLKNGKIVGYKLHRVKPNHLFFRLGAKSGDIVRKVNGFELNDTERMFELWKSIKTAPNVNLELERNGKLLTYNLKIIN